MKTEPMLPGLLVSYRKGRRWGVAVACGQDLAPLPLSVSDGRSAMRALLELSDDEWNDLMDEADVRLRARSGTLNRDRVQVGPTVPDPEKILCVGFNYADHTQEMKMERPVAPNVFAKFRNGLVADGESIKLGDRSTQIDYEGELAVVIGRRCRNLAPEEVDGHVAGFTILNDVTARDLQFRTSQWTLGKAVDGFCPMGPGLMPRARISDPQDLDIVTRLNGQIVQQGSTKDMVFSVNDLLSEISSVITLEPGDVITTGTPAGVGYKAEPPRFLGDGDQVEVSIEGVGTLVNQFEVARTDGPPSRA